MLKPCPSWNERLSAYLDGEGNEQSRQDVEAHLATCPACRAAAELYRCDAQDVKTALQARTAGDDFAAKVMAQVEVTPIEGRVKVTPARKSVPSFWSQFTRWAAVVCCIAVVGAILLPVFAKPREKARQTLCANNLRQIGIDLLVYANDHGGKLPLEINWKDRIASNLLICPITKQYYAFNPKLSGKNINDYNDKSTETPVAWCTGRHIGGQTVVYLDGHVSLVKVPDLSEKVPFGLQPSAALPLLSRERARQATAQSELRQLSTAVQMYAQDNDETFPRPSGWVAAKSRVSQPTITPPTKNYGLADKLQIAYVAGMALHSKDVQGAMERTELLFNKFDGFVLNSTYQRGEKDTAEATVSGRVPAAKLGTLLVELDKLGVLQSRTVNGEDLTAQHLEQLEQLGDLDETQARLGQIETRAKPNEALRAEEKLHDAEREESGLRVEEYRLKSKVTLAEVTVQIATPPPAEKKVEPVSQSASRATYALRTFGLWLLTGLLIPLLIWLPVWGVLLIIIYFLQRRLRRLPGGDETK